MATTTLTSLSAPTPQSKELCSHCESQPYDLICTCGDKFDFVCIQQHVEQISYEFQEKYEHATQRLSEVNSVKSKYDGNIDATKMIIENWKRKRIQDINDIVDKAINDVQKHENAFANFSSIQETYNRLSGELHRVTHDNLNAVVKLNQSMQDTVDSCENGATLVKDDASLDASLLSRINPHALINSVSNHTAISSSSSSSSSFNTNPNNTSNSTQFAPVPSSPSLNGDQHKTTNSVRFAPVPSSPSLNSDHLNSNHTPEFEPITSLPSPPPPRTPSLPREDDRPPPQPEPEPSQLPSDLINPPNVDEISNGGTTHDDFDAGKTRQIRRVNPVVITVNNDRFAAAVCCHKNQMLYNDYDKTTQQYCLTFLTNINQPANKRLIDWNQRGVSPLSGNDDEYLQDIVYSNRLSKYLLLNRSRLRSFDENSYELEEFHQFPDRTMKRLTCSDNFMYLTSTRGSGPYTGDEIILMNYNREEQVSKTFRDIIPSRLNRGAGPMVGEISDIAAGTNEQVAIGYRLERRHEVGVCLFNVTNDGRDWACVKQLLLNECWHSDLSYTPRLDWSEKLKVFILIEYITGHLIMIDRDGQIEGECRFMHAENRQESPINLTVSNNDLLGVRYASSISIHKLTS